MSTIEILSWPFTKDSINQINNSEQFLNYPVIYVLNSNKEAYIGETVYFKNRMRAHLKTRKNINKINLIKHDEFNRSYFYIANNTPIMLLDIRINKD